MVNLPPAHPTGATPPRIAPEFVPQHVALVMDGNGRWAKERGLPRNAGHEAGEAALMDCVYGALELGVGCRTDRRIFFLFHFCDRNYYSSLFS